MSDEQRCPVCGIGFYGWQVGYEDDFPPDLRVMWRRDLRLIPCGHHVDEVMERRDAEGRLLSMTAQVQGGS